MSPVPGDDQQLSATVQIDADGTVHDVLPFAAYADQNEAGTLTHYQFVYVYADDSYQGGVYRTYPDGTQELVASTTVASSFLGGDSGSVRPSINGLGHVGIYIGGGQFVHSPHSGDVVKISSIYDSWYASTWVGARRL